ncbi:MAG: tetratricopeptide repeat protein, partial [Alphaproteobacteria bacterium]
MRHMLLLAALFVALASPARASFEDGRAAHERGDYGAALREFKTAAERGDGRAQMALGFMYDRGNGVAVDHAAAIRWYRKAAEQGHAGAENGLGEMHASGRGVPRDEREAAKWFRRAAERGNPVAQNNLGRASAMGLGVARDHREAAAWFRRSAEQGYPEGQLNLGLAYANGHGVAPNPVEAYKWISIAALRLSSGPHRELVAREKDRLARTLSPAEIAEAERLASQWSPQAASAPQGAGPG